MLHAGQVYRTSYTVYDLDGPPSTAALAITKPDGTLLTPAPTIGAPTAGGAAGQDYTYTYDYTLTTGLTGFTWSTQGPGTSEPTDWVTAVDYISAVSAAEMRDFLGARGASDDRIQDVCMAATLLAETVSGTIVTRPFTDILPGRHAHRLVLPHGPLPAASSVTTVTDADGGQTWTAADLIVEPAAGRIRRADRLPFTGGPWTAVYTGGRVTISGLILQGIKEIGWDLWAVQRGLTTDSDAPDLADAATYEMAMAVPGGVPGYRIPPRALAYLSPERPLVTGFA